MRNDYGVGAGLLAAGVLIRDIARSTGRTTNLLSRVKDGEVVIAPNQQVAKHIMRELGDLGTKANVAIIGASFREVSSNNHRWENRVVHFDHTWVEAFYQWAIEDARNELFRMQEELSREPPPPPEPIAYEWVK